MGIKMKKSIVVILTMLSENAVSDDQTGNRYNPHSYGAPQLYYSPESIREREEQALLRESNQLAKERLEVEQERLQQEREYYDENSSR